MWAHGVLREGVRHLPTWWIVISAIGVRRRASSTSRSIPASARSRAFSAGPRTTSSRATRPQTASSKRRCASASAASRSSRSPPTRRRCARARMLFVENCAACHGRDGARQRALGAPDLTDGDWLYGGDGKAILTSILDGRRGAMPRVRGHAFRRCDRRPRALRREPVGQADTTPCARSSASRSSPTASPCHGADGKGNPALGAPNLTDTVWLYGGNRARHRRDHPQRPQRRDAGVARPPGRRGRARSSRPGSTRNRTRRPSPRDDVMRSRDAGAWFRQPVVWLGAAILVASIAGCIVTIVLAARHADTPVETGRRQRAEGPAATLGRHAATRARDADERLLALRRAAARRSAAGARRRRRACGVLQRLPRGGRVDRRTRTRRLLSIAQRIGRSRARPRRLGEERGGLRSGRNSRAMSCAPSPTATAKRSC